MPQKYTDDQKLNALRLLAETFGNTTYVASQTGISPRTLQYWKERYCLHTTIQVNEPENPADKYFQEQYQFLKVKLFKQVSQIVEFLERASSPQVVAELTPSLARLIDRIAKLEQMTADKNFTITIQWLNPDETINDDQPSTHEQEPDLS